MKYYLKTSHNEPIETNIEYLQYCNSGDVIIYNNKTYDVVYKIFDFELNETTIFVRCICEQTYNK